MGKMKIPQDELERLVSKYRSMNSTEFDKIQDILAKKETWNIDINLDIEMKVRNNRHSIFVEIINDIEALIEDCDKIKHLEGEE